MSEPLSLNDLLEKGGMDPRLVVVMRHRPRERSLRKLLPWWVHEAPELFNAYQRAHSGKQEAVLEKLIGEGYLASFVGLNAGEAVFAGVFKIAGADSLSFKEFWSIPENKVLKGFGMTGWAEDHPGGTRLWFDLEQVDHIAGWIGKLTVSWPPPERSWWRRAERNVLRVVSIAEESRLAGQMPPWRELVLTWGELNAIPASWRAALGQWRGVYLIHDTSDGSGYVGSAYGAENLLGRWLGYGKTGDGGNKHLRTRDPKTFKFSILERVSPDLTADEVVQREGTWKKRLHTAYPAGLNEN